MALRGKEETFVRRFAAGGNDGVPFNPRGYGDHSRRFAARGNEIVDHENFRESCDGYHPRRFAARGNEDHDLLYDSSPIFDEYEDDVWYTWATGGSYRCGFDEAVRLNENPLKPYHKAFAKLMAEIDYPVTSWEDGSVDEYLDYTINLLDLLNSISSSIAHVNQARVSLTHALSLMETSPDLAIERLKEIKKHVHSSIMELKATGFWVCGVVLSELKGQVDPMNEITRNGVLKITVVKGTNLAVRDMLSSDPYVVLTLGQQKAQTTVRNSNLNPVWNEELMLSVPQNYKPVKVQVFDHDTFSADDIMGEAEIDIQPLITSAMAFGDAGLLEDMQIGKWLKSEDNALLEDSIVNIIDGKVIQEVTLKLQNVESGEIDLRIEWMPLDQ